MTFCSSFQTLSDQLKADDRSEFGPRTKKSYSVKGEANHRFRWSLTLTLIIAYLVRVVYFADGYTLLSSVLFCFLFGLVRIYRHATPDPYLLSHGECFEDPRNGKLDCALSIYFSHELSPQEFDAFAQRLFEFQFWYTGTKAVIIALFLTWFSLIRFPSIGPVKVLMLWGGAFVTLNIISLVQLMATKFRNWKKKSLPLTMPDELSKPSSGSKRFQKSEQEGLLVYAPDEVSKPNSGSVSADATAIPC